MIRRYRLVKPHKIDRVLQPAGYEFEIGEQTGDWMVEQDYAEAVVSRDVPAVSHPRAIARRQQPALLHPPPKRWCCG